MLSKAGVSMKEKMVLYYQVSDRVATISADKVIANLLKVGSKSREGFTEELDIESLE